MIKRVFGLFFATFVFALGGCASTPEKEQTPQLLYEEATELHNQANYDEANKKFSELVSTYPTSAYSRQALVDQVYYYYNRQKYAQAVVATDRFISSYPDNQHVAYVLYIKSLSYFRDDRGILDLLGRQDPSTRDPKSMQLSFQVLRELVEQYPDSKYAVDATKRMRYLINTLAKGEISVAEYYMKRGAMLAAIGRAKYVLENYPDSLANEQAIVILMRAYDAIGAEQARDDMRKLLETNFPEHPALEQADG